MGKNLQEKSLAARLLRKPLKFIQTENITGRGGVLVSPRSLCRGSLPFIAWRGLLFSICTVKFKGLIRKDQPF